MESEKDRKKFVVKAHIKQTKNIVPEKRPGTMLLRYSYRIGKLFKLIT